MLGKWDKWYKNVKKMSSFRYGNTITYKLAADFLSDMDEVEDWGCGTGGFKRLYKGNYKGIDGSKTPFVDKVADLRQYRSSVNGIVMRHVLEHNYDWERILKNALASFNKKLCIIFFTPFNKDRPHQVITHNNKYGVDVPNISFTHEEIKKCLGDLDYVVEEHKTKTGYGLETIYYITK